MRLRPAILFALIPLLVHAAPTTPAPGSPERQAIADAMRAYVAKDARGELPKKLVFNIEFIRVDGDYAGFQGFPVFEDGTEAIPDHMPDQVYNTVLKRKGDGWQVVLDLTRTDVPDEAELKTIRSRLPGDLPPSVLTEFWRPLLLP